MPSLLTIDPSEINSVATFSNVNLGQVDTHNSSFTQVSSNLSDSPNTFVSSAQISSSTSIQDTQTVISTAPISQGGAGDAPSQAGQP